jgi:HemY protein
MRAVVWFVLLAAVAVVAAITLGQNDGLVSVYWRGWRLDLSLNLFVVALVLGCFGLVSLLQAIDALVGLPARARAWRLARRERAAQIALRDALSEYLGARYGRAQKAAQRALAIQEGTPELAADRGLSVLAHLMSAASAHRLQDRPRRDEQLKRALKLGRRLGPGRVNDAGAQLLAAEWALDDRDGARALALLAELPPGVARRTQALRLKLQAQRLQGLPLEALRTARLLAKHQGFSPTAAQGLLRSLAAETLAAAHDAEQWQRAWNALDASDRKDAFVAARAARRAGELGAHALGRGALQPFWDRLGELADDEREQVALALTDCLPGIGGDWLPRLDAALNRWPNDPALLAAIGAAFAERQLWGKARGLLEQAAQASDLGADERRRALRQLAALARNEGDDERERRYQQAAAATLG